MDQSTPQKRPWLAALLAAVLTGFGHLYLRRWRRALGWLAASFVVSALFVDPEAVDELMAGGGSPETLLAVSPMFFVVGLSIVDAYLLARTQNAGARSSTTSSEASAVAETADEDEFDCPHCGKPLDRDLEFCHWCTRSVADVERDRGEPTDET